MADIVFGKRMNVTINPRRLERLIERLDIPKSPAAPAPDQPDQSKVPVPPPPE
jgi:hypothetical protein